MRKIILPVCLVILGVLAVSCKEDKEDKEEKENEAMSRTAPQANSLAESWEAKFCAALPALGHRNWVVVADAAFPLQISPGMEVVVSGEDHFAVLDKVLKALGQSKHVRPKIYLDKELDFVPEELAPGMDACRKRLKGMLAAYEAKPVLHEELIARMDQVARTFRILMIKTNLTLPYTTVFLELDCGYWGPDAEAKMREKMK
ncbi:MAG: RbsD/FucU domain-containing protein [Candidatus Aminicenantales bacterium]